MSANYPTSLPSPGSAVSTDTLAAAGHTALHNNSADEIRAIATKIGTGSSTPASGSLLRATGSGVSGWSQADLSTDVTGVLPTSRGGTGTTSTTGSGAVVFGTSPTLSSPTIAGPSISAPAITGGGSWSGSPSITTPTISSFSNSTHDHTNAAGGGVLGTNSLAAGAITYPKIGTDSSFNWQTFNPSFTNLTIGDGVVSAYYTQIGKTIIGTIGFTVGASSAFNSSTVQFTPPVPSAARYDNSVHRTHAIGTLHLEDLSTTGYVGFIRMDGPNTCTPMPANAASTNLNTASITNTSPFSWGTGDFFFGTFMYEAA